MRFSVYYAALAAASLLCADTVYALIARGARDLVLLLPGAPRIADIAGDGSVFRVMSHHPALVLSVAAPGILIPLLVPVAAGLSRHELPFLARALLTGSLGLFGLFLLMFGTAVNCIALLADAAAPLGINLYPRGLLSLVSACRTVTWKMLEFLYPAVCTILVLGTPFVRSWRSSTTTRVGLGAQVSNARETAPRLRPRTHWRWSMVGFLVTTAVVVVEFSASRRLTQYDRDDLLAQLEVLSPEIGTYYLSQGQMLFSTQRHADALMALERAARYRPSAEKARALMAQIQDLDRHAKEAAIGNRESER